MPEFRYFIYKKEEIYTGDVFPSDFEKLLWDLASHGVQIEELHKENESVRQKIKTEDALILAASDKTLREAAELSVAAVGYKNPRFPNEDLFAAEILIEGFEEIDFYFLERMYQRKHGLPWRVIETKRCYLREMTTDDLPDLYEMYAGKDMTKYIEPLLPPEQEYAYTKSYIEHMYRYYGYGMWLIKDRETDALIGRAGLNFFVSEEKEYLEMGYATAVPYQRKGYAKEACQAVIAYAKKAETGQDNLYCFAEKENTASVALLKSLGFLWEKEVVREGKRMQLFRYSLLSDEKEAVCCF